MMNERGQQHHMTHHKHTKIHLSDWIKYKIVTMPNAGKDIEKLDHP